MSDCVQASQPVKGVTETQHKGSPSHDFHLLLEQESQVQEKPQIAHWVSLGSAIPSKIKDDKPADPKGPLTHRCTTRICQGSSTSAASAFSVLEPDLKPN